MVGFKLTFGYRSAANTRRRCWEDEGGGGGVQRRGETETGRRVGYGRGVGYCRRGYSRSEYCRREDRTRLYCRHSRSLVRMHSHCMSITHSTVILYLDLLRTE